MATPPTAGQVSTIYVESAMSAVTSDLYTLFITLENVEIKHFFPPCLPSLYFCCQDVKMVYVLETY